MIFTLKALMILMSRMRSMTILKLDDDLMGEGTRPLRVTIIVLGIIQMSPVAQKCPSLSEAFFEQLNYEYSKHIGRKYCTIL